MEETIKTPARLSIERWQDIKSRDFYNSSLDYKHKKFKDLIEDYGEHSKTVLSCRLQSLQSFHAQEVEYYTQEIKAKEEELNRKTDFRVMQIMSDKNLDIAMCPDMIVAKKTKKGGEVTIGLPPEAIKKVMNGMFIGEQTHYAALYIINKKQFNDLKEQ